MRNTEPFNSCDLDEIGMFRPSDLIREIFPAWSNDDCESWLWAFTPFPVSWDKADLRERLIAFRRYLHWRARFGIRRWPDPEWYYMPKWTFKRMVLGWLVKWNLISDDTWDRLIWGK